MKPPPYDEASRLFVELLKIIATLRNPNGGCPWDLEQTHASLRPYVIEEAYEVVDAIDRDIGKLGEELGDVLLQVVLHAQIGCDQGTFTISDILRQLSTKLVARHPHVFAGEQVSGAQQVLENWERIKQGDPSRSKGLLDGVPRSMPALLRAHRIGEKTARIGFDWVTREDVAEKVREEIREMLETPQDSDSFEEELGDVFFALAQWVRKSGLNAEEILTRANDKFVARFQRMEALAPKPLKDLTAAEQQQLWDAVKREEREKA